MGGLELSGAGEIDISTANVGTILGPYEFVFGAERAKKYIAAVGGDESPEYDGILPPAAIVAEGLSRLIDELDLFGKQILQAGGVVHTSQEAEFLSPIKPGESITASARLAGNSVRRGSRFVSVFTEFRNAANAIVATASSTIVVPV
jgi:hypothetical protein